ncbi:Death on curing protein, Doc toxin [hydrothermal vent metagenome]|uniref:Death on curing protein, Doc toxin n=1 Tax=hydrothermal vent metagenome TaxID=652676 RepID=A0A3B0REN9_9ZZZZ
MLIQENTIKIQGGSSGIRDEGLLESALARPQNSHAYGERDIFLLAAAYAEGLARNHAFVDGNKRAAYITSDLFLYLNGYDLNIKSTSVQITIFENLAKGEMSREELAEFYRRNTSRIEKP